MTKHLSNQHPLFFNVPPKDGDKVSRSINTNGEDKQLMMKKSILDNRESVNPENPNKK